MPPLALAASRAGGRHGWDRRSLWKGASEGANGRPDQPRVGIAPAGSVAVHAGTMLRFFGVMPARWT